MRKNSAASAGINLLFNCSFCGFHFMINCDGLSQLLCKIPGCDILAVSLAVESELKERGFGMRRMTPLENGSA